MRSSRVPTGAVGRNVEVKDDELGFVASDELNPQKSRILLSLALLKPHTTTRRCKSFSIPTDAKAAGRNGGTVELFELRKFETLSPFEIKDELIKLAKKSFADNAIGIP